jgi:uncharacterized alpha-E superfamily protein
VFALCDGQGSWCVLPGGMTRLVSESAGLATMAMGGSSADTWVLAEAPLPEDSDFDPGAGLAAITPQSTALVQRERLVTSRAAENLFWLGRYTERAENAVRLAQITLGALHGDEEPSLALLMWLGQLADAAGLVPEDCPSPLRERTEFERQLLQGLAAPGDDGASIGLALRGLRGSAAAVRERLSPEHWRFIKDAEDSFLAEARQLQPAHPGAAADALPVLARLSRTLAAVTGAQMDRMWRDEGWRMLSAGRQIERLTWLCEALSRGFYTNAVHDAAGYAVVLELFDSSISFHARHQRSRAIAALIEHVVLNRQNPRSIGWVLSTLKEDLSRLHADEAQPVDDLSARLQSPAAEDLPRLCESDAIGDFIHLQALLQHDIEVGTRLSDDIGLRHFSHTSDERHSV